MKILLMPCCVTAALKARPVERVVELSGELAAQMVLAPSPSYSLPRS